jgi:hypothetical protein
MRIGFLTKLNKRTNKHNNYRHIILYTGKYATDHIKVKLAIPLFIF